MELLKHKNKQIYEENSSGAAKEQEDKKQPKTKCFASEIQQGKWKKTPLDRWLMTGRTRIQCVITWNQSLLQVRLLLAEKVSRVNKVTSVEGQI